MGKTVINYVNKIEVRYGIVIKVKNEFVKSCINFFKERNFLTDKQINVIRSIQEEKTKRPKYRYTRSYSSGYYNDGPPGWTREDDRDFASAFDWGSQ